ncbi:MAG: carbonic anhydrase [Deltaproteobacteria bacterium]
MRDLYEGVQKFQQLHKKQEAFFEELSEGQSPDVLFIACSDSRVDPNLITQSKPGELFILKNIGNIIPFNDPALLKNSTAAAIEFAVHALQITDIVVCGHSDCGAMKALYYDDKDFADMPGLKGWLGAASEVKHNVISHCTNPSFQTCYEQIEKNHIVNQIENLKSYPLVKKGFESKKLALHGWYYDIGAGTISAYNEATGAFNEITSGDGPDEGPSDPK